MGVVRIGIGALALFAPSRGAGAFGLPADEDTPSARLMGRLFAVPLVRRQGIDRAAVQMAAVAVPAALSWLALRRQLLPA